MQNKLKQQMIRANLIYSKKYVNLNEKTGKDKIILMLGFY